MNITTSHLPSFCKALEDAVASNKDWVGFDERIEQLSSYDLHFFEHSYEAGDFQLFNYHQEREVILLPVEALLGFVKDTAADLFKQGKQFSHIEVDDLKVLEYHAEMNGTKYFMILCMQKGQALKISWLITGLSI